MKRYISDTEARRLRKGLPPQAKRAPLPVPDVKRLEVNAVHLAGVLERLIEATPGHLRVDMTRHTALAALHCVRYCAAAFGPHVGVSEIKP